MTVNSPVSKPYYYDYYYYCTMTAATVLINSNIPSLKLLSKGKVRDIYATSSPEHLLFVASDRISAYDVILKNVRILLFSFFTHSSGT